MSSFRRVELINDARREFTFAASIDYPWPAARAQMFVGICFQLLGEIENARRWYEKSYDTALEYGKEEMPKSLRALVQRALDYPYSTRNYQHRVGFLDRAEDFYSFMSGLSDVLHSPTFGPSNHKASFDWKVDHIHLLIDARRVL